MKAAYFTTLPCLLIFLSGCSLRIRDDLWSHCVFSAAAAGAVTAGTGDWVKGASIAFSAGLLKEAYDAAWGSGFSYPDLAANLLGSMAGAFASGSAMEGRFCLTR